jgi:outer membrane protein assembly factor BamB
MSGLLTGPLCGWPSSHVLVLANERSPGDLPDRLITAFEDVTDVALLYYVGHGQIDLDNQLCLGLVGSRTESNRRAATSLPFEAIRRALLDSPAATKIVLLDCCFAGLANLPANTLAALSDDMLDSTAGSGAYTMTASGAYSQARYDTSPGNSRPQTFFTRYLADIVETGIPGQPSGVRLHPLFVQLRENLARDQLPVPSERSIDAARNFIFAYNAAPVETQRDVDKELQELSRKLEEAEARRVRDLIEAEGRERELRAQMAEGTRELERLQEQARIRPAMSAGQQRQLDDAIEAAGRRLDETAAAHALAAAEAEAAVRDEVPPTGSVAPRPPDLTPPAPQEPGDRQPSDSKEAAVPTAVTRRRVLSVLAGTGVLAGLAAGGWALTHDNGGQNRANGGLPPSRSVSPAAGHGAATAAPRSSKAPGTKLWSFHAPGSVESGPVAAGTVVYAANDNTSGGPDSHNVYALNAYTGDVVWKFANGGEIYSGMTVRGTSVYIGSDFKNAYGLENGKAIWTYTADNFVWSTPAVAGNIVYVGTESGTIYALNAAHGSKLWSYSTASIVDCGLTATASTVYFGTADGTIYALTAGGGLNWAYHASGAISSQLAVANGTVYAGSDDGSLYAIDAQSGHLAWKFPAGNRIQSGINVANDLVYAGSADGNLYAIDVVTGRRKWNFPTRGEVHSGIAVADGMVYFGSIDGNIYAANAQTGHKKWSYSTDGQVKSGVSVSGRIVFAANTAGNIYAIQA